MKPDDMLRQARGTLDNITELAARLTAIERELSTANDTFGDAKTQIAAALRWDLGDPPFDEIAAIVEAREQRRRELEGAVRRAVKTLARAMPHDIPAIEARIELARLVPQEPDAPPTDS